VAALLDGIERPVERIKERAKELIEKNKLGECLEYLKEKGIEDDEVILFQGQLKQINSENHKGTLKDYHTERNTIRAKLLDFVNDLS